MTTRDFYSTRLDENERAIAGHDDDPTASMQMLVWWVITPMFLIGLGIIAWSVWQVVR